MTIFLIIFNNVFRCSFDIKDDMKPGFSEIDWGIYSTFGITLQIRLKRSF